MRKKYFEWWLPIKGYEGLYEVSNLGNVRSLNYNHTGKTKLLKKVNDKDGYHIVGLHKDKKQKIDKVHRLVAEAFLPNPENKPIVGHLLTLPNGLEDKTANEAWNIAWMTYGENRNYGTLNERLSECLKGEKHFMFGKHHTDDVKRKMSKNNYKCKPVICYTIEGDFVKEYHSINEAARKLKCDNRGLSRCANGEYKTYKGFIWRLKNEDRTD